MKSKFITLFTLVILFVSCVGQTSSTIHNIDVKSFEEKLSSSNKPQLIDVRTPEEFALGSIGNANNINWNSTDFVAKVSTYDKSQPLFVFCKVGGRSSQAAAKLAELGFKEIYNLEGGIMKWNSSGKGKPSDKIIGICDQEYKELINSSEKVLIDFNAKWCAPCQKMKPYILKFQSEMKSSIKIVQLDADENETIVDQMKLEGLPTLIIYEKGKEVWRNVGFISEEDLKKNL